MRLLEKIALYAIITVMCMISGCASVPTASPELERKATSFSPPATMASVYLYRPYNPMGSALLYVVDINSQRLGAMAPNTYLFANIDPGSHIINIAARGASGQSVHGETRFDAETGKLYFFKLSPGFNRINVEKVDEKEGREKVIGYKLSGYNALDRTPLTTSITTDFVIIERREKAYTVFGGVPQEKLTAVKTKLQAEKEVDILGWNELKLNADKYVKARILKDDYPGSRVVEGVIELVRKYPGTPVGLTWNGGIAITHKDYQHALRTYKEYLENPAKYERKNIQDPRSDPVNPKGHLGPLLGW